MRRADYWTRQKKRLEVRLILFALVTLISVAAFGTINLNEKRASYERRRQELEDQSAEEERRTLEIEELKKYMETKKFVEEIAKERLGLVYEDEILFKAKE